MTADHAARAVELTEQAWDQAADSFIGPPSRMETLMLAQVHATLALAEAVANSRCDPSADASAGGSSVGVRWPQWDDDLRVGRAPDADPAEYGDITHDTSPDEAMCLTCGRAAIEHTRGQDSIYGVCPTPDHPEIVTERGQERPSGAGDVQAEAGPDDSGAERGPR